MSIRVLRALLVGVTVTILGPHVAYGQLVDAKALSAGAVKKILAAAEAKAVENRWNVAIAVVDPGGDLLGFVRLDGASAGTAQVSLGKARTAAKFGRPTKVYADRVLSDTLTFLSVEGVYTLQGGLPIIVNGRVIGAVGVSGVTSAQDEQVAAAGIAAVVP